LQQIDAAPQAPVKVPCFDQDTLRSILLTHSRYQIEHIKGNGPASHEAGLWAIDANQGHTIAMAQRDQLLQ
jgi:hypothetical protein